MQRREPDGRVIKINEAIYCWNELCGDDAVEVVHADGDDYPLCAACMTAFSLGTELGSDIFAVPVKEFLADALYDLTPEEFPKFVVWWEETNDC